MDLFAVYVREVAEGGEGGVDGGGLVEPESERLVAADRRHLDYLGGAH